MSITQVLKARFMIIAASFIPLPLLLASANHGGMFSFLSLAYMTLAVLLMDELTDTWVDDSRAFAGRLLRDGYPLVLGAMHFILLPIAIYALTRSGQTWMDWLFQLYAFGLFFGIISFANAHELIHRRTRIHRVLGEWVYSSLMFGHHASAHLLVHHIHVATPKDPCTARGHENFYQYMYRAWLGTYTTARAAENAMRARRNGKNGVHPFVKYYAYGLTTAAVAAMLAGWAGVLAIAALAAYSQTMVFLTDYVQHFGLQREKRADGSYEPVSEAHSWDAPHWFSALLTLNAPLHSQHHAKPSIAYTELRNQGSRAPQLPYSLLVMAFLALFPRIWRSVMIPRLHVWNTRHER